MAAGFIIAGAVIIAIAAWQIMESINFNKAARDYMTQAEEVRNNIDAATKSDTYTLVQILHELNRLKKQNEDLLLNAGELIEKNKFVLFKDKAVISKINNNQKTLETLSACSDELISILQRSEQIDKDIEYVFQAKTATWNTIIAKCEGLIKENDSTRSDAVKLVVPDEIRRYQNILVEALTEKGKALNCLNDFIKSAFNAEVNANMAASYYYGASYYWDLLLAYEYAQKGLKYGEQAKMQAAEFKEHWDKYKKLKEKISGGGESI